MNDASVRWPSRPAWPVLGHAPAILLGGLGRGFVAQLERSWKTRGDRFELDLGRQRIKVLVHPDDVEALLVTRRDRYRKGPAYDPVRQLIGLGLVTAEDERWRRERRLIQPSFKREAIASLAPRMVAQTDAMLDRWAVRDDPRGQPFDVHAELMRLALEIIADTLFGLELGGDRVTLSTRSFSDAMRILAAQPTALWTPPAWLPTPGSRRLDRAIIALDHLVSDLIRDRRRSGVERDDLLGALLRATTNPEHPLDERQLRDEVLTMFLAGHETTAVALTWTLWLLAQHREVLDRTIAEVDAALGDRAPTAADLPALAYVGQVFHEAMRVIPPVWSGARDCVVADSFAGLPVAPGDRVMNAILLTHRHPEFWPEPSRFDPDRFSPSAVAGRHKFAYTPFSEGPRKCVGIHFATMEAQLVLARLLQRGRFVVAPGFVPTPDYQLTTRPRHGLRGFWRPT